MFKLTCITRISDSTPLSATMETNDTGMKDFEEYKQQRKQILKQIQSHTPKQLSVESSDNTFHILTDGGVCYLTLTEKGVSSQLVFSFLNELKKEFSQLHGADVEKAERPYAFITFGNLHFSNLF
jgi:vesicle transport protein SEC22